MTIKSLDGLRGLAVLLVFLSHMSLEQINLLPALDFSGMGKAGVYLFLSLSAFLLTWQALDAGESALSYPRYWAGYLLRRVLRIYPLYIVALLVSLVLTGFAPGYTPRIDSPQDLLGHLVLLEGTSIYWAIPVEFTYYLLLPGVALALYYARQLHSLAPLALSLAAIATSSMIWPAAETPANSIQLGPYLGIFFIGSLAASFCSADRLKNFVDQHHLLSATGFAALLIAGLTVPALWRYLFDPEATNRVFHKEFLFYGLLWGLCILAAMRGNRSFTALFEWEPLRFLGRISFSVYLWHYLVVQLVAHDIQIHSSLQFLLVFAAVLPLSWLSYRVIERPFINWGHRTTNHWHRPTSAA